MPIIVAPDKITFFLPILSASFPSTIDKPPVPTLISVTENVIQLISTSRGNKIIGTNAYAIEIPPTDREEIINARTRSHLVYFPKTHDEFF